MDKITVTVCLGTTCHLLGSSHLQSLESDLPGHLKDRVRIAWSRCLGYCNDEENGKAPFVLIGKEIVGEATAHSIFEKLEALLKT